MSLLTSLQRIFGGSASLANGSSFNYAPAVLAQTRPAELPAKALYDVLTAFYYTNSVYEELRSAGFSSAAVPPQIKALRNPVAAVVDVLGGRLYPEPLIVTTPLTAGVTAKAERQQIEANDPIKAAIAAVHDWSNWRRVKRKHARWAALYGEAWVKVVCSIERGRVYFELIEPRTVTEYSLDERGFVTMCRLDVPQVTDDGGTRRVWTHVEVWSKDEQSMRIWRPDGDASGRALADLGPPAEETPFSAFGITFVPLVRSPFREIDAGRAIGAVQLAIEAIMEADLAVTNLHAMIYSDADGAWVLRSVGTDANNRPLPAPRVGPSTPTFDALGRQAYGTGQNDDGTISVGKRQFWRLPGNQELQSVVANIDYAGALAILESHMAHLEKMMPALSYLRISEMSGGDLSGRAINYKMRPFIDQVEEGRSNLLAALFQADCIALSMGAAAGIPGFENLGTFEAGDFDHDFAETPILPVSSADEADEALTRAQTAQALSSAGVPLSVILMTALGKTEQEAAEIVAQAADAADASMVQTAQLEPARPVDAGGNNAAAA